MVEELPPPVAPEVAQGLLARLNRLQELESSGEVEPQSLRYDQLEAWQDHHPERNLLDAPTFDPAPAVHSPQPSTPLFTPVSPTAVESTPMLDARPALPAAQDPSASQAAQVRRAAPSTLAAPVTPNPVPVVPPTPSVDVVGPGFAARVPAGVQRQGQPALPSPTAEQPAEVPVARPARAKARAAATPLPEVPTPEAPTDVAPVKARAARPRRETAALTAPMLEVPTAPSAPALPVAPEAPRTRARRTSRAARSGAPDTEDSTDTPSNALTPLDATQLIAHAVNADGHGTPLPLSTQDALARTLGVQAPDVRVVQHAGVTAALDAYRADALAVPGAVLVRPDVNLSDPGGVGLLTHEFTHVLRDTQPNFVPQIAREVVRPGDDEEHVAVQAERQVRARARRPGRADAPAEVPVAAPERPADHGVFAGLPAPWEPMPFWEAPAPGAAPAQPSPQFGAQPSVPFTPSPTVAVALASALPSTPPVAPERAAVRTAATDRSAGAPSPSAPPAQKAETPNIGNRQRAAAAGPDLDQLARDVYAVLKARLDTEVKRLT
ncbi:eCIS core domain-containing protein [Deinococcus maricopensis]|uniref:eCIS core domain-containing protein n=1 Tax=Deinococcus maricopensis (strain DSM 21211 / LMG 22137 / NRRL B-23946 / LB-34) TaxID=709986 RepID=E8U3N1_DEIML|nr:DUF4157 domain-containing protein [Deinococcus maricopensis]ADV68655.1 hypothetical protein Deima_3026 [Deinococcus maricopensis DSM 21211]